MKFLSTVAIVVALAALWFIRKAWRSPWDRPAVFAVTLMAAEVVLESGFSYRWLGPRLHALVGFWNLEDLLAHSFYLIGMFCILYLVASRLDMTSAQCRWFMRQRIELPLLISLSLMSLVFVWGGASEAPIEDTTGATVTHWLYAYWLVLTAAVAYVVTMIGRILLILRSDPRSKRAATAYLGALSISALCIVVFTLQLETLQWFGVRAEVIGYALAACASWHSKNAKPREVQPV